MSERLMKALVLEEYGRLVFRDAPVPALEPDEVLVRVKACGICGSDVHGMDGSTGRRIPPLIMGHEASGVIDSKGAGVVGWDVGDRVTFDSTIYREDDWYTRRGMYNLSDSRMVLGVSPGDYRRQGAFAEFVAIPQHILHRIPDGVSFNQAAMVEPAAVALHAIRLTPIELGDVVVVIGTGMVGLFVVQLLRSAGCGTVVAVDLSQERLGIASGMGADLVLHAERDDVPGRLRQITEGRGADVAFEVVGIGATVRLATESIRKGGCLTLVGNLSATVELPLQAVVTRQLRLQGSCAICGEYPAVLDLIRMGRLDVDAILSATAPLSEGPSWFRRLYEGEPGLMKVILNP